MHVEWQPSNRWNGNSKRKSRKQSEFMLASLWILAFTYTHPLFDCREKAKANLVRAFEAEKKRSNVLTEIADLVPSSVQDTGTHTISVTHIDSLSKLTSTVVSHLLAF